MDPAQQTGTVLIVEDEPLVRDTARQFVARLGHRALSASNGKEGLACMATEAVDAILLDMAMPEMNGEEGKRTQRALTGRQEDRMVPGERMARRRGGWPRFRLEGLLFVVWLGGLGCSEDSVPFVRGVPGGAAHGDTMVPSAITDSALARAVARTGVAPDSVEKLTATGLGIQELAGIQELGRLTVLDLSDNDISDIGQIGQLSMLVFLDLSGNRVSELRPLGTLLELRLLALDGNRVRDIAPLLGLSKLESVELSGNPVPRGQLDALRARGVQVGYFSVAPSPSAQPAEWSEDELTPVVFGDAGLRDLVRSRTGVLGYEELQKRHVKRIGALEIRGGAVERLDGIWQLENLAQVALVDAHVADLSALVSLEHLREVRVRGGDAVDFGPLGEISTLTRLTIADVDAAVVPNLSRLRRLATGVFTGLALEDLEFLRNASTSLRELVLSKNALDGDDLFDLGQLSGLRRLDVSSNRIEHLDGLAALDLRILLAMDNQIDDLSGLRNMRKLRRLCMAKNDARDLSPLALVHSLRALSIARNGVSDLSPLSGIDGLVALYATSNAITDLEPLRGLTKLEHLWIGGNRVESLSALRNLPALRTLRVEPNPLGRGAQAQVEELRSRFGEGLFTWPGASVCNLFNSVGDCSGC